METAVPEVRVLLNTFKLVMKSRKLSYRALAKKLKLSESAVKKMFCYSNCSLGRVFQICESLEVSFPDLVDLAYRHRRKKSQLTLKQEGLFIENQGALILFIELIHRATVSQLKERHALSATEMRKYLRILERASLIEVHAGDRIRLLVDEPLMFSPRLRDHYFKVFLSDIQSHLQNRASASHLKRGREWLLSQTSLEELKGVLEKELEKIDSLSVRDRAVYSDGLIPVSLAIAGVVGEPLRRGWSKKSL